MRKTALLFTALTLVFSIRLWGQTGGEKVFLRWVADKKTVYQGESFGLQLKLYYEKSVSSPDIFPKVVIPNTWIEQVKNKPTPGEERLNGKMYGVVTLKKYLVIPQKSGNLIVPDYPLIIRITVPPKPDDFFQVEQTVNQTVTTPSLTLQIVSLPEPKPATFAGAVGTFTWVVKTTQDSGHVQKPIGFTYQIEGTGNIPFLALPPFTLPAGLEGFEVKSTESQTVSEKGVTGKKTFAQTLVAEQAGRYALPFGFTYFDPAQKKYITLTDSVQLLITDTTQNSIATLTKTPKPQVVSNIPEWYAPKPAFQKRKVFFNSTLFWILALLPLAACLLVWGWVSWKKAQHQSSKWPYRQAMQELGQLKKRMPQLTPAESAKQLEDSLFRYLKARYSLSTADWYADSIARVLSRHSIPEAAITQFLSVLENCQRTRFSNQSPESPVPISEVQALLRQMEQQYRASAVQKAVAIQAVFLVGMAVSLPLLAAVPARIYAQAQQLYQQQQFDSAISILNSLASQGFVDAAIYMNLGNSYLAVGKTGLAILNYEKALQLAPADSTIRAGLHSIRQKQNLVALPQSPFAQWSATISVDVLAWLGIALCWIGGVLVLQKILFSSRRFSSIAWLCGFLAMAVFLFAAFVLYSRQHSQESVVVAEVTGRYAPSPQAREMVRLPEGSSVRIEDEFAGWTKVYIPDGRRVWIPKSTVRKI